MHPDDAEWDAWTPAEAAVRLQGVDAPWYVAAGWAIDLFLGEHRRERGDRGAGRRRGRADARRAPDVGARPGRERMAHRRLPRTERRWPLGRAARRIDHAPLRRADRAHRRRHPVRAAGGRAALQGEGRAAEGRGRPRGGAAAARAWSARAARGVDRPRAPGPLLATGSRLNLVRRRRIRFG